MPTVDPPRVKKLPDKVSYQGGKGRVEQREKGKPNYVIEFGSQISYADGRTTFGHGVKATLPDKNGRSVTVESRDELAGVYQASLGRLAARD